MRDVNVSKRGVPGVGDSAENEKYYDVWCRYIVASLYGHWRQPKV